MHTNIQHTTNQRTKQQQQQENGFKKICNSAMD